MAMFCFVEGEGMPEVTTPVSAQSSMSGYIATGCAARTDLGVALGV
jgi:hypothetical protein